MMIHSTKDHMYHKSTKHIDIWYHFVYDVILYREVIEKRFIQRKIIWICS